MKIAWFCIPAWGHTNPTVEVVRRLTETGHRVRYYAFEQFRETLEGAGAEVIPIDEYCAEMKLGPDAGARIAKDTAFATEVLVDTTLAVDGALLTNLQSYAPDVIVADSMAMWGKLLARKLGVPYVCSTTTFAFNQHSAKVMQPSLGDLMRLLLGMGKIKRQLGRLRARGYEVKGILDVVQNDNETDTIVYTSAYFQPCAETFSDRYAFVGPSVVERPPLPRTTGRKRVYISMGTVNNDMPALYRACIEALAEQYELILSVGQAVDPAALGPLPAHVTAAQRVDQMAVFAGCDAFLTHCGMNSVSEALYCGVPLVLFPQTNEQRGVANRTAELGAGVLLGRADAPSIRRAVDAVIQDGRYREGAGRIQASFRICGGAQEAAAFILQRAIRP